MAKVKLFPSNPTIPNYKKTLGFSFGKTESEAEDSYKINGEDNLFDDYLRVLPKIGNNSFIISGRKGCGKSAIAKYITDNSTAENDIYSERIDDKVINLERTIQNERKDSSEILPLFFEWLILTKFVNLFLRSGRAEFSKEIKKLQSFVLNNSGIAEIDKFTTEQMTDFRQKNLSTTGLRGFPGISIEHSIAKKQSKAKYYNLLPTLREAVLRVLCMDDMKDIQFTIFFDDLDNRFKADNIEDKNNLFELIRVAKELNNTIRTKHKEARILIFLRDDIIRELEGGYASDSSKIQEDYLINLNWFDKDTDEKHLHIRTFVNDRISKTFKKHNVPVNEKDAWSSLIVNQDPTFGGKTAFKFILDYTFYRPRDFIIFLNSIGEFAYHIPIKPSIVKALVKEYCKKNVNQLKDELSIHYTSKEQIDTIFSILKDVAFNSDITSEKLEQMFSDEDLPPKTFKLLMQLNLIHYYDTPTGRPLFGYREKSRWSSNPDNFKMRVHKCIYGYFNPDSI